MKEGHADGLTGVTLTSPLICSFDLQNQMPWSQSTSLHIYHSITYRMSKMAKINRATRIALVTGDMRDCISAASAKAAQFATVHWGAWMLYHPSRPLGFDGISCTDISREWFTNIRAKDITSDHLEKGRLSWSGSERRAGAAALVWNRLIRLFNFIRWNCPMELCVKGRPQR